MQAVPPPAERSDIERAVHAALQRDMRFTAWPKVLKRAYLERTRDAVRRELRMLQWVGLCIAAVSCLLDLLAMPEEFMRGLGMRTVLVIIPGLFLVIFARRLRMTTLKIGLSCTLVGFGAIVMHMASFADPATATRYTMGTTFLLCAAALMLPLFREELVGFSAGFVAATFMVALWPNPIPPLLMLEHLVTSLLTCAAGLVIAIRYIEQKHRAFLHDLRDEFIQAELEHNIAVLRQLSESDALTGLPNRRSFRQVFDTMFVPGQGREGRQTTVMMIDLDHFKAFNDAHGHQAGDRALRSVAHCLEAVFRDVDGIVARFGGEEFIAAFYSGNVADAEALAERIRTQIGMLEIPVRSTGRERITTSIGLASTGDGATVNLGELTGRADRALYRAKSDGRNRVVVSEKIELRIDRLAS